MIDRSRTSAPWLAVVPLAAALVGATTAAAQMGADEEPSYDGTYGGAGGAWLEGSGGVRLSGNLGPRVVPDAHTVRRGDTLWDITGHYFGNPWEWPRVWSYNPEITNPHWIYPDDRILLRSGADEDGAREPLPDGDADGIDIQVVQPRRQQTIMLDDQGYIERDALQQAGTIVGSPEEHMLLSTFDEVYVRFENGSDVRPGQHFTVFREIDPDERLEEETGTLVRIFGGLRVRTYDPEEGLARAVITEALDPIERGYRVADVPRRFRMVPPLPNRQGLVAQVVATLRPRSLLADQQVIFVDAGAEEGVMLGNRFFIMQRGDQWRDSLTVSERKMGAQVPSSEAPDEYPLEVVAEGRVVDVQHHSAALIVTRSLNEVSLGDRAEMRKGF
ncbi:MAG: LysM peptidoglycan-binding domain-containing protein [Myxococcota bacterium]